MNKEDLARRLKIDQQSRKSEAKQRLKEGMVNSTECCKGIMLDMIRFYVDKSPGVLGFNLYKLL